MTEEQDITITISQDARQQLMLYKIQHHCKNYSDTILTLLKAEPTEQPSTSIPKPVVENPLQAIAREREEERQKELATCYVCENEFPATELTKTMSGKLLCPECKKQL